MTVRTLGQPKPQKEKVQLSKLDRCDAGCPAQAMVAVSGSTGTIMFCAHHYNKIMSNPSSRVALEKFATETIRSEEG